MFDLTGKTALVTGATGAIGKAIARALHQQGATIAISGRRPDSLNALAAELNGRVVTLPHDLAHTANAEQLVTNAEAAMGKLDIVVANAGIIKGNLLAQMNDEEWEKVVGLNLTASAQLARAAVRGMIRRRFGRIIGITSLLGVTGFAGHANYAAAKAGMIGLFKSVAHEYADRGVTANCIAPGFVTTPMAGVKLSDDQIEAIVARIPAGRLGAEVEVATAVVFLASDEASYITGQTLHINRGLVMI